MGLFDKKSKKGTIMQSISMGAKVADMKEGSQSAPTSPIAKSTAGNPATTSSKGTGSSRTSTAAKFFTFRWLFRGSKNSSKKLRLKQMNDKTKEKLASITGTNTTKILLRQSYSFDDIQQFLLSQQNNSQPSHPQHHHQRESHFPGNGSHNSAGGDSISYSSHYRNKILCKSSLDIESKKSKAPMKCLAQFKCKLCLTNRCGYQMHSIWSCGCAF
ncbi:unnamed protein product, partial [Oppiella nova]